MLYIFSGLPGVGKSTLAAALAHRLAAVYMRIDTIEQTMRNAGTTDVGGMGYAIANQLALDNLRLGQSVVADSVNSIAITIAQCEMNPIELSASLYLTQYLTQQINPILITYSLPSH